MKRKITLMKNQIATVIDLLVDQIIHFIGFLSSRLT